MAYALLAGLPPVAGLYASLVPLLLYPIFGSSRQLSVGPVAMDSLLVAAGVGTFALQGSDDYLALAILLALMVGIFQILMGALKLGFVVNFLSQPLINGFTSAAAIIIGLSQIKHLFGVDIEGSQKVYLVISRVFNSMDQLHIETLILGLIATVVLFLLKYFKPNWPSALIVVILSIIAVQYFNLADTGMKIVGEIPEGLPHFQFSLSHFAYIPDLIPTALALSLISYMEGIAIAKKTAAEQGYTVSNNRELLSIGIANFSAGLFGGYPIAGSFSRTAVNVHAGARTAISSVFTAILIALVLLFLTPLFYYMPKAVLASIVIVAVIKLIDIKEPKRLFKVKMTDFIVLNIAFVATLIFGAQQGILLSAIASIVLIIRRISYPNVAVLGRVPGTNIFRNIKNEKKAIEVEGVLIFRIDASLYYANSGYLKDKVQRSIAKKGNVKLFILDMSSVNEIDATAIQTLHDLNKELITMEIEFYISNIKAPVLNTLENAGFCSDIGRERLFHKNEDVLNMYSEKMKNAH